MGRKTRRKKGRGKGQRGGRKERQADARTPAEIEEKLEGGQHAEALRHARTLCAREPSERALELRLRAYLARVDELIRRGCEIEAATLVDMAAQEHPRERTRIMRRRDYMLAWRGDVDALVAPLADPGDDGVRRGEVEAEVARWVTDPALVAGCGSLPDGHPLRMAAEQVREAFDAVTTREVGAEEIALAGIPRRSPLAGWKMLVRAMDAFHRGDDASCERALGAVDDGTPPGAIKAAMLDIVHGRRPESDAARAVAEEVGAAGGELGERLEALDRAVETGRRRKVLEAVKEARRACERERPDLLEELLQRQSISCAGLGIGWRDVRRVMGGPSRKNARFWRLFARQAELLAGERHDPGALFMACAYWQEAVGHAVAEGAIPAAGPAEAAMHLHVASLLAELPEDLLRTSRRLFERKYDGLARQYEGQPPEIRAAAGGSRGGGFLYPERMFARAARMNPSADVFRRWLDWARTCDHWRPADEAALAWHDALPGDVTPLLLLASAAEGRNAIKRALKFVEEAERLDAMRSDVRRARARLWMASLRRHVKGGKPHLARRDLEAIGKLPAMRDDGARAFLEALRWVVSLQGTDDERTRGHVRETQRLLGDPGTAEVMLGGVELALGSRARTSPGTVTAAEVKARGWWPAAARACALAEELQLPIPIAQAVRTRMMSEAPPATGMDAVGLVAVCNAALGSRDGELAFRATGAGLRLGGGAAGRFLLLRSRALDETRWVRMVACLRASITMAWQAGDEALAREARESLPSRSLKWGWMRSGSGSMQPLDPETAEKVLRFEAHSRSMRAALPGAIQGALFDMGDESEQCDCPECRAAREGRASPFDDDEDGFEEELYDDESAEGRDRAEREMFEILQVFVERMQKDARKKGRGR